MTLSPHGVVVLFFVNDCMITIPPERLAKGDSSWKPHIILCGDGIIRDGYLMNVSLERQWDSHLACTIPTIWLRVRPVIVISDSYHPLISSLARLQFTL